MSTGAEEMRSGWYSGTSCFRCGNPGHWADSESCPWLRKAATPKEHEARIGEFVRRFHEQEITPYQKREFIRRENELWKAKAA